MGTDLFPLGFFELFVSAKCNEDKYLQVDEFYANEGYLRTRSYLGDPLVHLSPRSRAEKDFIKSKERNIRDSRGRLLINA